MPLHSKLAKVKGYVIPFIDSIEMTFPLYLIFNLFPWSDLISKDTSSPLSHSIAISKAPLPFIPDILPEESADGNAGSIS
jgi:hypothetical protein